MAYRTLLIAAAAFGLATSAQAAGDPAKGKTVFARCAVCHSLVAGQMKIGPSLHGVLGRKAGTLAGYTYSAAMKAAGAKITWSPTILDTYLQGPQKLVPGTKMAFPGVPNPTERADVIAYLVQATK